jgi:ABC-type branched-subunit amino acid transport system substrate-binding protein
MVSGDNIASRHWHLRRILAAWLTLLVSAAPLAAIAADLSAAEFRGKLIYTRGESESRRVIRARLQRGKAPVPAAVVPCIGCHGSDGQGDASESTVPAPPSLQWGILTDPSGHRHNARQHGRLDDAAVARAIRNGADPDGNRLDATMPRYVIHDEDMADLIAYLKAIAMETDPGVTGDRIRIGTVLPFAGPLAGQGKTARMVLDELFAEVNDNGGIHGRRLELVVGRYGATDDPAIWAARDLISREPIFALLAPLIPGFDAELAALAEENAIPLIGPYTNMPAVTNAAGDPNSYSFYLLPGLEKLSATLVQATADRANINVEYLGIVYPRLRDFDSIAAAAEQRAEMLALEYVSLPPYRFDEFDPAAIVTELNDNGVDAVLFLGNSRQFADLAVTAAEARWQPTLLAPGSLAEKGAVALTGQYAGQVFLAYPSMPSDASTAAAARLADLQQITGAGQSYEDLQVSAYASVDVLVNALRRAGNRPSRTGLLESLTAPAGFDTGLLPPVSFSDSSRIGINGAHVVEVDIATGRLTTTSGWTKLAKDKD